MIARLRELTPNHLRLADQLAAEATFAHTTINTAYVGDRMSASPDRPWEEDQYKGSVAAGGVLAESTGGRHNLDLSDLRSLTSGVRSRCMCIYRIGLEARQGEPHGRVYQARVDVRGRKLKPRYRVSFLNEADRWIREARGVLRNPSRARDLSVGAALVPVKASDGTWDLAVQLAVDPGSIEFVTSSGGRSGLGGSDASWEAGALLFREEDDKDWEMLGVSGAHRAREGRPGQGEEAVLHEHVFTGVHPGRYRLAAFVKDRSASLYGGAEASLELPAPRAGALTKPVLLLDSKRHLMAPLPLFQTRSEGESRAAASRTGAIPASGRAFRRGEVLIALTWFCGQEKGKPVLRRFISKDGAPAFRLAEPRVEPAGDCSRIADRIETAELEAGSYAYNIEYRASVDARPASRSQPFIIEAPSPM
jgi:hypothetical protein